MKWILLNYCGHRGAQMVPELSRTMYIDKQNLTKGKAETTDKYASPTWSNKKSSVDIGLLQAFYAPRPVCGQPHAGSNPTSSAKIKD